MKHIIQRVTSLLLCAMLLLQMVPAVTVHVHAEESAVFTRASVDKGLAEGTTYLLIVLAESAAAGKAYYTMDENGEVQDLALYYDTVSDSFVLSIDSAQLAGLTYGPLNNGSGNLGLSYADGMALDVDGNGIQAVNPVTVTGSNVRWEAGDNEEGNFAFDVNGGSTYYLNALVETDTSDVIFASETEQGQGYRLYALCTHADVVMEEGTPATCVDKGVVYSVRCLDCGVSFPYEEAVELPATGHKFVNGVCEYCDSEDYVYAPITSYPQLYALDEGAEYILVADVDGTLYTMGMPPAEMTDRYPGIAYDLLEVTPAADGTISANGLDAARFQMISTDFGSAIKLPNYWLKSTSDATEPWVEACYVDEEPPVEKTGGWYLEFYDPTADFNGGVTEMTYAEYFESRNSALAANLEAGSILVYNTQGDVSGAMRLRDFENPNGKRVYIAMGEHTPEEGATDQQYPLYLYAAFDHVHQISGEVEAVNGETHAAVCSVNGCGYATDHEEHTFGEGWVYVDANQHAQVCTVCGYQQTSRHRAEYTDNGNGTHSVVCAECAPLGEAAPHQWGEWSYNANMSLHVRTCQLCFAEETSPLHVWGNAKTLESADCVNTGIASTSCTVDGCQATKEWEIAALGHDLTEWYTMSEPTETTHGQQIRYCRNCGESETRVIPAKNHEHKLRYVEPSHVNGTIGYYICDEAGVTEATSGCYGRYLDAEATQQVSIEETQLPSIEHNWGNWYYPEGDAAIEKGLMVRDCLYSECWESQQWIDPLVADPEHQHQMFKVEATESTCTVQGNVGYYICLNERLYDESGAVIGYQGYWDAEGIEPMIAGEELLPTVAHSDFEWEVQDESNHFHKCSVCGYAESIPHTYNPYDPENGITETVCRRVCITCGYEEENPDGHNFINSGYVDCGDGEHHQSTCYFCEATFTMPHNWSVSWDGDVVTDHYCVEYGCYYSRGEEHIWVMSDERKDATCTAEGEQGYICAAEGCTGEKTEFIPMLEHTDEDGDFFCDECETNLCFDQHVDEDLDYYCDNCKVNLCFDKHVDDNADYYCDYCQTNLCFDKHPDENLDYYCDQCNTNLCFDEHPDENNDYYCDQCNTNLCFDQHEAEVVPGKEASCTETGLTEGSVCKNCGLELKAQEEIPVTAHTDTDADYYCDVCKANLCFNGHVTEVIPGKEPSCTETGLTEGSICKNCKLELVAQEEIPMTNHRTEVIPAQAATCIATGLTEGSKCTVCNKTLVEQQVTEKLPHTIVLGKSTQPTCTETGLAEGQHCEQCGLVLRLPTELPATGHSWSEWQISKEPTQIQNGVQFRYCEEGCGAVEEAICPAYGHLHHLVRVAGYEPSCSAEGRLAHYECIYDQLEEDEYNDSCGCLFLDAEGTQQVTANDLVIPATGKHEMVEWTVHEDEDPAFIMMKGTCACGAVEYRPQPRETHVHTLVYLEAAEATCTANGAVERYACTTCPCLFADAEGSVRMEEKDQAILTTGHKYGKWSQDGAEGHSRGCTQCELVQIATSHVESPLPGDTTGETCAVECLICKYQTVNNGHRYSDVEACGDRWQHQQSCSVCAYTVVEDHEFGDWVYGEYEQVVKIEEDGTETTETVLGHYRSCHCGARETSLEHIWDEGEERNGHMTYSCIVSSCDGVKEEFLRCIHTCLTCGKCTAEVTCPDQEACDCAKPETLVTTDPDFLHNNIDDPNETYLGDVLVKEEDEQLDPDAKPGQEIPEEYAKLTVGIQEVPLIDEKTGEELENPYTDYVKQALTGYSAQHLFDIHLLDSNKNITESPGNAQYLIRLCLDEEIVLGLQKGLLRLAHITEKGTSFYGVVEDCIPFYKLEDDLAWFWADSFSPFALVEPQAPYYGREALAKMDNKDALLYAYDQIVAGVETCQEKIQIYPAGGTPSVSIPELQMVMDAYTRDHTEHFWLEGKYSISYKKALNMATAVKPTYSMTGDTLAAARAEFEAAADAILHGITDDMSEFDRQLLVHDRLAAIVEYDKTLEQPHVHDAYGALVNHLAVCQGYAEALQYLLRRVGIQSFVVTGYSQDQSHAWNQVQIDNEYYHTDLTWNDQGDELYHAYFNMSDPYITEDHSIYLTAYPMDACQQMESNYFKVKKADLTDAEARSVQSVAQKLKGSVNGMSFLLTESTTALEFLYWFIDHQDEIFEEAGLQNVKMKQEDTYTYLGREAMIHYVAENGEPPHICGQGTTVTLVTGQAATCTAAGWKDYYLCSCDKLYAEQSCQTEITNLAAWKMGAGSLTASHSFGELVPAQPVIHTDSQMQNGVAAHYRCTACDQYFTESKAVTTLNSLTTKPEHTFGGWVSTDAAKHWKACSVCGKKDAEGAHTYSGTTCTTCGHVKEAVAPPSPGISSPAVDSGSGKVTLTLAVNGTATGKVMVAVYDAAGRMLGISYVDETITIDSTGRNFTVVYDKNGTPRQIKAFLMDTKFAPSIAFDPQLLP